MSNIALTVRGTKLLKLFDALALESVDELINAAATEGACPAICMTEGCDYIADMEVDQCEGYCKACGGNTMVSALVLARELS